MSTAKDPDPPAPGTAAGEGAPPVRRWLPGSGVRLAADAYGDPGDPAVLFFHGGGQTRHSWKSTAEMMGRRGWYALTVDLRGHGESDWPEDGGYTIDDFRSDVVEAASSLGPATALVGASLGGVACLLAAGEAGMSTAPPASSVAGALVLVDIAPRIEQAGANRIGDFMREHMADGFANVEEAASAIAAYNPLRPPPADMSGVMKNLRRREDGRLVWHWDPRFLDQPTGDTDETRISLMPPARLEAAARSVHVPTMLVRGRMSDVLSEEGAREFLALVPHAEYVDVAGAGHMVAGDRNDVFNEAIVGFLDGAISR